MSTDRDTTRIVRSWLRTDEHDSADRVLDIVIARLDTTPQRRSPWPARRIADMNTFLKVALAAAAVVVVAIVGINLLPTSAGVGVGPAVSQSPSPTPSLTQSPTPAAVFPPAGPVAIGRHSMIRGGIPFSFSLPTAGWDSGLGYFISKDVGVGPDGASFMFWDPDPIGVYADPCDHRLRAPAGPSPADLAADISTIPGTDVVRGPSNVTVGGRDAIQVVITVPKDAPCEANDDDRGFLLWYDEGPGSGCGGPPCPRYPSALGVTIRVWIIDALGTRLVIEAESYEGAGPEVEQEIQQIVDSIQFE
jgi:hypothetical protein